MRAPRIVAILTPLLFVGCGPSKVPELPEKIAGTCDYKNSFSNLRECRDYMGEWDEASVRDDCNGWDGTTTMDSQCKSEPMYGFCIFTRDNGRFIRVTLPGDDASKCGSSQRGCELFGGGKFVPSPVCGGSATSQSSGTGLPTFVQPTLNCVDPLPGEAVGQSADGKVCTWEAIAGATESGRDFRKYASCDKVLTQRPYYPAKTEENATRVDERLNDPTYVAELNWVRKDIESTACVCCHSSTAPKGPSNWFVESEGNFMNSFYPRGLAMGAGWIPTIGFGAYAPEQNNGFTRATPENPYHSAFVTSNDARMRAFFENELKYRGFKKEDFADQIYGAGPLDEQRVFRPSACKNGEGVQSDGSIKWSGGQARYVYVLEAEALSPTVPPNLDLPQGTLWRLDVPVDGQPVSSQKVTYGNVPDGVRQKFPSDSARPTALTSGKSYYLYVTADVGIPITRCLFTAP